MNGNSPGERGQCGSCGAVLQTDAPEGLCPRCLVAVNLTPTTDLAEANGPEGTRVIGSPLAAPLAPAEIARSFPHLEIVECLGRGGMGVVYKARQPRLDRWVALKLLAPERERDGLFVERFTREAQALARLNHPAIIAIHDFGEAGGLCYLLMEYVDGVSLRQLMQARKLQPEEALRIVPQICEALQYAHEQKVIHRDIKPENILLDRHGRVKIADFGIAKMVETNGGRPVLTEDRQVIGTPHYMAPEQVEKPHTVDHRADIYSLGVVFYEMLTGELPLGKFAPPSARVSGAPLDLRLDEVVLHTLEKQPERRYQHVSEVKTDVETIATSYHAGEEAAPPTAVPSPRGARWLWAAAGVAGLLASWMAWRSWHPSGPTPAPPEPQIVFPADAGIVDVTQPPYSARPDGVTDATAAIQQALNDFRSKHAIVYLPQGTYLVTNTLRWGQGQGSGTLCKFTTLQGQSRSGTVIRLQNAAPGFDDPAQPRSVIWTGPKGAERYRNSIRNLTVDTGQGNPGAIGIQFNANQGCVRDVSIRSGDGKGVTGLDMSFADDIGPLLVKNLSVLGFNVGIHTREVLNSQTFEHITLEQQNLVAFLNDGQAVSVRDLRTLGRVPAFRNEAKVGLAVLVDATLTGSEGAGVHAAILNRPGLLVRNLRVSGFGLAIAHSGNTPTNVAGTNIAEWISRPLPGSAPALNLPVKETPEVPWGHPADWANAVLFGASKDGSGDDSGALQRAIDSGKETVYLPRGEYTLRAPVQLRGRVRRLIGCEAFVRVELPAGTGPVLTVTEGAAPVVVVERLLLNFPRTNTDHRAIDNRSSRTLVIRDCGGGESEFTGPGELFLENVDGRMTFHGQQVWARQFSQATRLENSADRWWHVRNEGGRLWILGERSIGPGPVITTRAGGQTELLGGLLYSSAGALEQNAPAFLVEQAALSVSINEVNHGSFRYPVLVRRLKDGGPEDILTPAEAPGGVSASLVPLFTTR